MFLYYWISAVKSNSDSICVLEANILFCDTPFTCIRQLSFIKNVAIWLHSQLGKKNDSLFYLICIYLTSLFFYLNTLNYEKYKFFVYIIDIFFYLWCKLQQFFVSKNLNISLLYIYCVSSLERTIIFFFKVSLTYILLFDNKL